MPPGRSKKAALSPVFAAVCAPVAIILIMALARASGGSFAVKGLPQDPSVFAFIFGGAPRGESLAGRGSEEIAPLPAARLEKERRLNALYGVEFARCYDIGPAYSASPCGDAAAYSALLTLEGALAVYPEGFFDRMPICFFICGEIRSREAGLPDRPSGVLLEREGVMLIALDAGRGLKEHTVFHEICHAADKLIASSPLAESFRAGWEALNPPGFAYYGAYTDAKGFPISETGDLSLTCEAGGDPAESYFINRYSKTFPEEDRAVLFETLMRSGAGTELFSGRHIIMKLSFYFAHIRAVLDPEGSWRGPVFWEERLAALSK